MGNVRVVTYHLRSGSAETVKVADAQDAAKELAEKKFRLWLENVFGVYGNRDGRLVTLESDAGERDVLTREEFLLLEPGDVKQALDELASVREILDGMIEQVEAAQKLVS